MLNLSSKFAEKAESYITLANGIFLLLLAVSGNFVAETLGCKTQYALSNNMYLKNLVILFMIYFTINFTSDDVSHPLHTLQGTVIIWIFFVLFSRMRPMYTLAVIILLLITYILNNFRKYYKATAPPPKDDKSDPPPYGDSITDNAPNAIYFLLVPVYRPNHAAPAPTTILTRPDCSIDGLPNAIYHMTTLYNKNMYVVMNTLGKIRQAPIALAKCIIFAYGFIPKSLIEVSTSRSTCIFCLGSAILTSLISSLIVLSLSSILFFYSFIFFLYMCFKQIEIYFPFKRYHIFDIA